MTWEVRRVHYATYAELAAEGFKVSATEPLGRPDVVVARGLTVEQALAKSAEMGFGHSAHLSPKV